MMKNILILSGLLSFTAYAHSKPINFEMKTRMSNHINDGGFPEDSRVDRELVKKAKALCGHDGKITAVADFSHRHYLSHYDLLQNTEAQGKFECNKSDVVSIDASSCRCSWDRIECC